MRRFGEPVRQDITYRRRPGVYVIAMTGRAVLLTFQAAPEAEYQLPGGGIDPGESPLRALHRETMEETGWRIAAPRRLGLYRRNAFLPSYGFWAEKLCTIYLARAVRPVAEPSEPGHSAVLVAARVAVDLIACEGDRAMLARLLR